MKLEDIIFVSDLPTLDLHGLDRDYSRIKVLEFIKDNKKLNNKFICIVHGIGTGALRNEVHKALKSNKDVVDYRLFYNNVGCTIVELTGNLNNIIKKNQKIV